MITRIVIRQFGLRTAGVVARIQRIPGTLAFLAAPGNGPQ
jgi:hypothetical protein